MSTVDTSEYVVKENGFFLRRTTVIEEPLGSQGEILKNLSQEGYTLFPDSFSVMIPRSEVYEKHLAVESDKDVIHLPVHLCKNNRQLYAMHRVPYSPLYGPFSDLTPTPVPDVNGEIPEPKELELKYSGTTGKMYRVAMPYPGLWAVYKFRLTNNRVSGFINVNYVTNIRGEQYAPCLPNIFENGKVCLGGVHLNWKGDTHRFVQDTINELWNSRCNDHLVWPVFKKILRFKRSTENKTSEWTPDEEFLSDPKKYHKNRNSTVAAEPMQMLIEMEEAECSTKVGK